MYELRIDTDGDLVADITYQFRFSPSENGQSATVRRVEGADPHLGPPHESRTDA